MNVGGGGGFCQGAVLSGDVSSRVEQSAGCVVAKVLKL